MTRGVLVHGMSDSACIVVRVPSPVPRQGAEFGALTGLIPGIQPDRPSYSHAVLGVWDWDGEAGGSRLPLSAQAVSFRKATATPAIRNWARMIWTIALLTTAST